MTTLFQDVTSLELFFEFFNSRFEMVGENLKRHFKTYRVSNDELLTVQVSKEEDPYSFGDSHYFIILYPKNEKLNSVRFFGTFFNKEGVINYDGLNNCVDKKLGNKNLILRMNELEYVEQSVNPYFLLFGLTNKQRFVRGSLEKWVRDSEGKIHAKENIRERMIRVNEWKSTHPNASEGDGSNFKYYEPQECVKAGCTHFKEDACELGALPHNDKSASKLQAGTGYCEDYNIAKIDSLTSKFLKPVDEFRAKIERLSEVLISKFDSIPYHEFDLNVASSKFDSRKFAVLMAIVNGLDDFKKEKFSERFKNKFGGINSHYDTVTALIIDFCKRRCIGKSYKKSEKEMMHAIKRFSRKYGDLISELNRKIKTLKRYNRLCHVLFTGSKYVPLNFSTLKVDMVIYSIFSKTIEASSWNGGKKYNYINVGRVKNNTKWEDYNLALTSYYSHFDKLSYYKKFPIYRVISASKGEVELEDIETKQKVKLIPSREYSPRILLFSEEKGIKFVQKELLPNFQYVKRKAETLNKTLYSKNAKKVAKIDDFLN